jgi:hypothetical protein
MGAELAVVAAFIKKLVDFVRQLRGRDMNAVLTQLFVWVAGIVVVWLTAHVNFGSGVEIANVKLDDLGAWLNSMNLWTQSVVGVLLASSSSIIQDLFKAVDPTQSEAKPKLFATKNDVR